MLSSVFVLPVVVTVVVALREIAFVIAAYAAAITPVVGVAIIVPIALPLTIPILVGLAAALSAIVAIIVRRCDSCSQNEATQNSGRDGCAGVAAAISFAVNKLRTATAIDPDAAIVKSPA